MRVNLYATKPAALRLVKPLEDWCVRRGISPNMLSAFALAAALAGAGAIVASPWVPGFLWLVPVAVTVRLVCNLLDGSVARRTGFASPRGELVNEVGDRIADAVLIVAPATVPGVFPALVLGAVVAALLASYVGIAAKAAGGARLYGGILSKPGRMTVLALAAVAATVAPAATVWNAAEATIAVGSAITAVDRTWTAFRVLAGPPP